MIKDFEPSQLAEPEEFNKMQWPAALGASLIAGLILVVIPRGSPWSSLTFFSPVIMGRILPPTTDMPLLAIWLIHLVIAVVYGLIISRVVAGSIFERAILIGGVLGFLLYFVNLALVSMWLPDLRGNEISVIFTHIVFGLIVAGAYRGLLKRRLTTPNAV
jgi:hypothetical protein